MAQGILAKEMIDKIVEALGQETGLGQDILRSRLPIGP